MVEAEKRFRRRKGGGHAHAHAHDMYGGNEERKKEVAKINRTTSFVLFCFVGLDQLEVWTQMVFLFFKF